MSVVCGGLSILSEFCQFGVFVDDSTTCGGATVCWSGRLSLLLFRQGAIFLSYRSLRIRILLLRPPGVAWWAKVLVPWGRYCQSGFDCLGKVREAATWFQFSLLLLVVLRLYAVEMTPLRSVVGLPPFRVLFARVRGRHPLLAMVVSGFGKVVLCLIVLRTLV